MGSCCYLPVRINSYFSPHFTASSKIDSRTFKLLFDLVLLAYLGLGDISEVVWEMNGWEFCEVDNFSIQIRKVDDPKGFSSSGRNLFHHSPPCKIYSVSKRKTSVVFFETISEKWFSTKLACILNFFELLARER